MIIKHMEQGSLEWHEARRGRPTASAFKRFIVPSTGELSMNAKKTGPSDKTLAYIMELIDQLGRPEKSMVGDSYISPQMVNGISMEPRARSWYEFQQNVTVQQVGIVLTDNGRFGASPDFMVDPDGAGELKCPDGPTHLYWQYEGVLPDEHKIQVHSQLAVIECKYVDFMSYCPPYDSLLIRVFPDAYTDKIKESMAKFWTFYALIYSKLLPSKGPLKLPV